MAGEEDDKKKKAKAAVKKDNSTNWPKAFSGHIIYEKNGMQVLRAVGKDLPFEIVVKDGIKKVMPANSDPDKIDFDKLPELNLKDYNANVSVLQSGGEEKVKANTVPLDYKFDAWGALNKTAHSEGWYPASHSDETTEYRNSYGNQFNQVQIPGTDKRGYISVIGGNKNNVMDVVIKDDTGKVFHKLLEKVRPDQVDEYFRNEIKKRADSVTAGTNIDKMSPEGTYVSLK